MLAKIRLEEFAMRLQRDNPLPPIHYQVTLHNICMQQAVFCEQRPMLAKIRLEEFAMRRQRASQSLPGEQQTVLPTCRATCELKRPHDAGQKPAGGVRNAPAVQQLPSAITLWVRAAPEPCVSWEAPTMLAEIRLAAFALRLQRNRNCTDSQ